jgi:peptide methionine sulfoxide reductase MsrB
MSYTFKIIQSGNSIVSCSIDVCGQNVLYVDNPDTIQNIYVIIGVDNSSTSVITPIPWPGAVSQYDYDLKSVNILTYQNSFYLCASFYQESKVDDYGNIFIGQAALYLYSQANNTWIPLTVGGSTDGYFSSIVSQNTTFLVTYTQYKTEAVFDASLNHYVFYHPFQSNAIYSYDVVLATGAMGSLTMIPQSDQYYWNGPMCILSDSGNDIYGVSLLDISKNSLLKRITNLSYNTDISGIVLDIMQYDLLSQQWSSTGFDDTYITNSVTGIYSTINNLYVLCDTNTVAIYDILSCQWNTSILSPNNDSSIYDDGSFVTKLISVNCYTDSSNQDHVFVLTNDTSNNGFLYNSSDGGNTWSPQTVSNNYDAWSNLSCSYYGTLVLGEYYNNPQAGNAIIPTISTANLYLGNFLLE